MLSSVAQNKETSLDATDSDGVALEIGVAGPGTTEATASCRTLQSPDKLQQHRASVPTRVRMRVHEHAKQSFSFVYTYR